MSAVTPAYEDAGLFRTALRETVLELIPQVRRNDRNDFIVRGFIDRTSEVDIWIAGRRAREVGPLERQLKALVNAARGKASGAVGAQPAVHQQCLPVRALGAWRRSATRDDSGWETGSYHFVVARWSFVDAEGKPQAFGEMPRLAGLDSLPETSFKEAR
jgi:hypothetical protein